MTLAGLAVTVTLLGGLGLLTSRFGLSAIPAYLLAGMLHRREVRLPPRRRRSHLADLPQRRQARAVLVSPRGRRGADRGDGARRRRSAAAGRAARRRVPATEDRRGPRDGARRAPDRVGSGARGEPLDRQDA